MAEAKNYGISGLPDVLLVRIHPAPLGTLPDDLHASFVEACSMDKGVEQFIDELKQPPAQLELFKDSEREFYRKLMISILEHSDEIHRMHKLMIEVLGEDYDKKKPTA